MRLSCFLLVSTTAALLAPRPTTAFTVQSHHYHHHITTTTSSSKSTTTSALFLAKRKRGSSQGDNNDDLNRWYDTPRSNSSPNDVFWEEMERQRLLNKLGDEKQEEFVMDNTSSAASSAARAVASTATSLQGFQNNLKTIAPTLEQQMKQQSQERNTESTLTEYMAFQVPDNWLNEQLVALHGDQYDFGPEEQLDVEEQDALIEQEMLLDGNDGDNDGDYEINSWDADAEPWDIWGQPRDTMNERAIKVKPDYNNEFLVQATSKNSAADDEAERLQVERDFEVNFMDRMKDCKLSSQRLEKARDNPKAKAFFERDPDALEGFDRMWVCAVDSASFKNLAGVFRNYGVQFADNFGDFNDGCEEDGFYSIEDVASWKARKLYEITGLPVITSCTGFEVEPVSPAAPVTPAPTGLGVTAVAPVPVVPKSQNPMVASGYRFNRIGDHVDYIIEALKPVSAPNRVTRYRTCLCFYDGEMELYEFSTLDCDLHWATSLRTFIPVNQAINQICKTLQLTFGLEYMKWLKNSQAEANSRFSSAVTQLRDRVLKDGRVLPNAIIDVSAFMDSMVDVNLMDDCAKELSERFKNAKPTKILTVATTGLVIALPMAKYLQVPVVYARKERNVVMADTYKANYSSKTVGKNNELLVSKSHLLEDDRILVVDDFLSSGAVQDALLRIVSDAGCELVGVGVLLEKVYDSGRQSLSGYDVPVESLCRVASVKEGVIQLLEEEGFDLM